MLLMLSLKTHVNNRIVAQPRGKVLGGSSAINFTAIVYPARRNFASWTALGNRGWSALEMEPYFKKFHTYFEVSQITVKHLSLDSYVNVKSQGSNGPVSVTVPEDSSPFGNAWMKTFEKLGFADISDPIDGEKLGPFTPPCSIDPKLNTRSYAAPAYYNEEVSSRSNLKVLTETHVQKVILEEMTGSIVAKGVQVESNDGVSIPFYADEVILSAGTFQSPQILELSGIGPRSVLERSGISVLVDNPGVGANLQDHPFASVSFEIADDQVSGDVLRDPQIAAALLEQYQETRQGPFAGSSMTSAYLPPVDGNGTIGTQELERLVGETASAPETVTSMSSSQSSQYALLRDQIMDPKGSSCQFVLQPVQMHYHPGSTSMAEALAKEDPRNMVSIMIILNHPFSRGTVHIQNGDPRTPPLIDPCYLSHPLDLEVLARGIQYLDKIVQTEPLAGLLKSESRLPRGSDLSDLNEAKEVVKARLFTTFHPCSTCSMMPRELGGVVDDKMRVYGVRGLRVVDASIFPLITQGNIQATVYAVAERAADIIKEGSTV